MRVYVAGKTHDMMRVRAVQELFRHAGHTITYDWTKNVEHHGVDHELIDPLPEQQREYATYDREGVRNADLVCALGHPRVCGTLVELGMAIEREQPVWLVGEFPPSVFWHLPNVMRVEDHELPALIKTVVPGDLKHMQRV